MSVHKYVPLALSVPDKPEVMRGRGYLRRCLCSGRHVDGGRIDAGGVPVGVPQSAFSGVLPVTPWGGASYAP